MVDVNRHACLYNLATLFYWVILVSVFVLLFLYRYMFLLQSSSNILKGLQQYNIVCTGITS